MSDKSKEVDLYEPDFSGRVQSEKKPDVEIIRSSDGDPYAGDQPTNCGRCFMYVFSGILVAGLISCAVIFLGIGTLVPEEFCLSVFGDCEEPPAPLEVDVTQIITEIRAQAFIETARADQTLEVRATERGALGVSGSLRYRAFLTVTAGVDLMSQEPSVVSEGQSVTVTLPQPQIRDCILNLEESFFYEYDCTLVGCDSLEDTLPTLALESAANEGTEPILADARLEAQRIIGELVQDISPGTQVSVQFSDALLPTVSVQGTCAPYVTTE